MENNQVIKDIEKEFDSIQSLFNEGKKYLIGKDKNKKLAIEIYDKYYSKLNDIYSNLNKSNNANKIYINHLVKLSKIYLLIPYYYKSKIVCEKVIEIDKNNIDIIPTYIKCLHYFRQYSTITDILNNINIDNATINDLKKQNEERKKQTKGVYDLKNIYLNFRKTNNFNLDIAEYISNKISIKQDKVKGLVIIANEDILKGEILIAERAIEYVPLVDKNLKYNIEKEEWHELIKTKIKEKMLYCKEDNPEIFVIYNGLNTNLSLEERKNNYLKNIHNKKDINITQKEIDTLFTDSFSTKLYIYDELSIASGLFYYSSFLSHSCTPNTHIFGLGNFMFIISEKNIKKNEELTTFYVENDKEFSRRQIDLYLNYGFQCECELCKIEKENFDKNKDIKCKISYYIEQLIDMSVNMLKYNLFDYFVKHKEVNDFIENNKGKIKFFEQGLLYYNLYYLWRDIGTNYTYLEKALNCFEKDINLNFNNMIYYCLLKMYKMNYVCNPKLCEDIKNKIIKLLNAAFRNSQNEFVETIVEDIIKMNTKDSDPDIILFKEKFDESFFG